MRIGEVLLRLGTISDAQLEDGLRAQVMWGGRLGTNLVDLGYLQLDDLSRALGRVHDLPAALESHFARADRELQQQLHADLAVKYDCVPLVRAGKHIVIASSAPLDDKAVALVAGQLDINRHMIVQSIAAEMRIRFQLERVYGIVRDQRFLRSRGTTEQSQLFRLPALAVTGRVKRSLETDPLKPSITLDVPPESPRVKDASAERRRYLHTLADMLAMRADGPTGMARVERLKMADPSRSLAIGSTPMPKIDLAVIADSLPEALSDIELSRNRDELARRVIGTVGRFVPESRSALLLMIRGEAAVSWTSFCRDGMELPPLAVPLDQPGLIAAVMKRREVSRGAAGDLQPVDHLLLASLGVQYGDLVVAPVSIAGHVIGTIVLATEPRAALASLNAITTVTSAAFTRLMRTAARDVQSAPSIALASPAPA